MDLRSLVKLRGKRYSSNLDKFSKLKDSIFGVLYVLLKENEGPIIIDIILTVIEFLEFMIFPFSETVIYNIKKVSPSWNAKEATTYLRNFFVSFSLVHYLHHRSATLYLVIFYLSVVAVTLVIVNIAYVSYSFSRKYFTLTWPLYVLRNVAKIFVTILFMPFVDLFLSVLICHSDPNNPQILITEIGEIRCFYGFHFLHVFCSIIVSIVFLLICLICALTFFECSNEEGDLTAKFILNKNRENSRADFILLLSKIIKIILFSFFNTEDYAWVLILSLFSLSIFQFIKFYIEKPYYNHYIQLLMLILNGSYMWTCSNLLFAHIFKNSGFKGAIYIWAWGLPLINMIIFFYADDRLKVVSTKLNEFKKGEEVQKYIRYFLDIVVKRGKERSIDIHLKGFIYNHEENCFISDCPLKKFKKYLDKSNYKENKEQKEGHEANSAANNHHLQNNSFSHEGHASHRKNNGNFYLYEYAKRVFLIGLSKFPNCTSLRIFYAIFLWDNFKQKNNALQEFSIAEKNNPPFDQQFIIFRYKKIISEEEERGHETEALDIISGIAYDSHFKQCQTNIQKASQLYLDFWEHLNPSNSSPDIAKLNDLALKINNTITSIEIHWKNMQAIKPNDPKALKIYSGFLIEVLNDKERGNELLSLWRETADKKQTYLGYLEIELNDQLLNNIKEGNALILCSAENESYGNILKFSHSTCKIFGYTTSEIYGKNIEYLFLECYYTKLNSYIQHVLTNETNNSKGELFFGRSKYHYAVPLNINILNYKGSRSNQKSFLIEVSYVSDMIDLRNKIRTGYFIIDSRLKIINYTSLTYEFICQFFEKLNSDSYFYLNEFFPEIYSNKDDLNQQSYSSNIPLTNIGESQNEIKLDKLSNENNEIKNDQIHLSIKHTIFYKSKKPIVLTIHKNPEIKGNCERDIYRVELSLHTISALNNNELISPKHKFNDIMKLSLISDQVFIEEEEDTKMYAVKLKIHFLEEPEISKTINYREHEIFPKLDEIIHQINTSNHKSFLEILKNTNKNIFNFYAISNEGEKLTEMVQRFNFGGFTNLYGSTENEIVSSEGSDEDERSEDDSSEQNDYSNEENENDEENDSEEEDIVKTNEIFTPQQILKGEEFSKMKNEELKKNLEKIIDYGKKVSFRILNNDGYEEHTTPISQLYDYIRSRNHIISTDESVISSSIESADNHINPMKKANSVNTKKDTPPTLLRLSNSTLLLLIILLGFIIFQFILNNSYFNNLKLNFSLMQISFQGIYKFQNSLFLLRNIILSNNLNYTNFIGLDKISFINYTLNLLIQNQNDLASIRNQIFTNTSQVLPEHLILLTNPVVPITFQTNTNFYTIQNFNLIDSFALMDTTLLSIITTGPSNILDGGYLIYNFIYNCLNDFMFNLNLSANYFVQLISNSIANFQIIFILLYCVSFIISVSSIIIIYSFLVEVELDRTKVLGSFYAIPNFYVKWLSQKCDTFLNKIQKINNNMNEGSEDDENDLNMDIDEIEKNYGTGGHQRIPKKVEEKQGSRIYLIKIIVVFMIIFVLFTTIFAINTSTLQQIKIMNVIYNDTSIGYSNYSSTINILREKFINPKMSLFRNMSTDVLNSSLQSTIDINNQILFDHLINNGVFSSDYISLFENITHGNLCNIFPTNITNCGAKINSLAKFGFQIIMTRYFQIINIVIKDFYLFIKSNDLSISNTIYFLNKSYMNDLQIILYDFIYITMNDLCENILDEINRIIDSSVNMNMIMFILFLIFILVGYLIIWLPFESRLKDDISRTKLMLEIIPDQVIKKVEFLKNIN